MTSSTHSTKTVLITGASTGFGRSAAQLFAQRGWNVIATMRDPAAGSALADLDTPGQVLVTRLDVQDLASIDTAMPAASRASAASMRWSTTQASACSACSKARRVKRCGSSST
jgi:NAD(P)-dependent dehydrogenase (short-subunit alcohol dehydrogenase family)